MDYNRLIKAMRMSKCLACECPPPVDIHHIKSRGAGGKDDIWNVIPLCRFCHSKWHNQGAKTFLENYPSVKKYLESVGWVTIPKLFNELNNQ
jgi:5-methylcytosine-specific restriction endonuclease McrA